ncbi:MAG: hypothetical protein NTY35_07115 [Planctomycetota bacterium]|nr:hypothetical protein [Planctomycetota bacterium]
MKTAILVISDPNNGAADALGRVFNALALAHESKNAGDQVELVFEGAGTRWPEQLVRLDHPLNGLWNEVRDVVVGASCGCAEVFGSAKGVEACGVPLVREYALPGTPGVASMRKYLAGDWKTLVF